MAYIDRSELNAKIEEEVYLTKTAKSAFKRIVYDTPSADVAPVRHGRWEWSKDYDGDSILVCSECGRVCHEEDAPYCYCGCKMDLEAADA